MTRGRIAVAVLLLFLAALGLARLAPPIVNTADIGVSELYVELASHGRLLVGPYSRFYWHHPGPLYFYLQAPLYAAAGRSGAALYAGAWAINLAAFAALLWTLWSERRPLLTTTVGGAVLLCAWRLPDLLASPWSAHIPILPFLALVAMAAAAAAGRTSLFPAVALTASFAAQTNLALLPPAAITGILLIPAALGALRVPGPGRRHAVQGAVVALIAWLPPLVDVWFNRGGNAAALWAFFRAGGIRHSFREALAAWSFSAAGMLRSRLELPWGKPLDPSGAPWAPAAAIALAVLILAVAIFCWRRERRFEAWLGAMLTAALLVTLWSLTRIVETIGDYQVLPVTALGAMALGVVAATAVSAAAPRLQHDRTSRPAAALTLTLAAAAVAIAALHFEHSVSLQQRLPWAADVLPAVDRVDGYLAGRRSRAVLVDIDTVWSQAVPVVLRLRQRHRRVTVTPGSLFIFTEAFAPTGKEDTGLTMRPGRRAAAPGTELIFDSWTFSVQSRAPR